MGVNMYVCRWKDGGAEEGIETSSFKDWDKTNSVMLCGNMVLSDCTPRRAPQDAQGLCRLPIPPPHNICTSRVQAYLPQYIADHKVLQCLMPMLDSLVDVKPTMFLHQYAGMPTHGGGVQLRGEIPRNGDVAMPELEYCFGMCAPPPPPPASGLPPITQICRVGKH